MRCSDRDTPIIKRQRTQIAIHYNNKDNCTIVSVNCVYLVLLNVLKCFCRILQATTTGNIFLGDIRLVAMMKTHGI